MKALALLLVSATLAAARPVIERAPSQSSDEKRSGPVIPNASVQPQSPVIVPAPQTAPPSPAIVPGLEGQNVSPGRHYWHHWYGYYDGPHFFWTRFYHGHWWWRHPAYGYWAYWDDGSWRRAPPAQTAETSPLSGSSGSWESADGTRLIQITPSGDAYLYAAAASPPRFLKHLASDAQRARFSGKARALSILLDLKNGGFLVFDRDGAALQAAPKPRARSAAPKPPPSGAPEPPRPDAE